MTELPLSPDTLTCGLGHKYAERGEAVPDGNIDLKLGDLAAGLPRHQALAQQLHAVHLGFGPTSAMVAAPLSLDFRFRCFDARNASLRAMAPALLGFHNLAFLRGGLTASAQRSAMAS